MQSELSGETENYRLRRDRISLGMPSFHKILETLLVFLLRDVARYRFNVIRENLASSFRYENQARLNEDIKGNYRFLAKILGQIIIKPSQDLLRKKLTINNKDEVNRHLAAGKSVIVTLGHVGNWEWICLFIGMVFPGQTCALYKRIKSEAINRFMIGRRTLVKGYLIEGGKVGDLIKLIKSQPVVVLMIADQNPGHDRGMIWTEFFGKKTAFVNGPETLAAKYNLPLMYLHSTSNKDGGYELSFEPLYNGNEKLAPGQITTRYANALERNIRLQRSEWLWSHKRWKRKFQDDTAGVPELTHPS